MFDVNVEFNCSFYKETTLDGKVTLVRLVHESEKVVLKFCKTVTTVTNYNVLIDWL